MKMAKEWAKKYCICAASFSDRWLTDPMCPGCEIGEDLVDDVREEFRNEICDALDISDATYQVIFPDIEVRNASDIVRKFGKESKK
jgi:hypothetical protein